MRGYPQLTLPVGQRVEGGGRTPDALVAAATDAFTAEGFQPETPLRAERPPVPVVVAERNLRRVAMQDSMRVTIGVLVAAGAAIGILDALVIGTWAILALWLAIFGLVAALLWLRYGRQYETEMVIGVAVAAARDGAPSSDLLLTAGRVRSIGFDGARTAIQVVDCPLALTESLAAAVRRVQLRGPTAP